MSSIAYEPTLLEMRGGKWRDYMRMAIWEDVEQAARTLTKESREELRLLPEFKTWSVLDILHWGYTASTICVVLGAFGSKNVFGIGGVVSFDRKGSIWLLLCNGWEKDRRTVRMMTREARSFLKDLHTVLGEMNTDTFENYVSSNSEKQIRWLQWLGAEFTTECGDSTPGLLHFKI